MQEPVKYMVLKAPLYRGMGESYFGEGGVGTYGFKKEVIADYDVEVVPRAIDGHAGIPLCSNCESPLPSHNKSEVKLEDYDDIDIDGTTLNLEYLIPCVKCGTPHIYVYASNIDEHLMEVEVEK